MDASSSMGDHKIVIQENGENAGDTPITMAGNWIHKVNNQLQQLNQSLAEERKRWEGESIYRIPWYVKKLCSGAFQPQTVSIGPYHHGKKSLEAMEKHKQRALLNFLARMKKPLQCYVNALEQVVDKLMGAYDQLQPMWNSNKEGFLQLMIVDGCFILELINTAMETSSEKLEKMGYAPNDPVFSLHGRLYFGPFLRRDMLMLENQIPMLVLNTILVVADPKSKEEDLHKKILKFFHRETGSNDDRGSSNCSRLRELIMGNGGQQKPVDRGFGDRLHILDLYRRSMLLEDDEGPKKQKSLWARCCDASKEGITPETRSASELLEAGIGIGKSKTTKLNDISFECGVLKLPSIDVDDAFESAYLNMMALERFHAKTGSEVTWYVYFMDRLIDSGKDVSLLHWHRIVQNSLGDDEAVAKLFNSLSKETCPDQSDDNILYKVQQDVDRYYRSPPRRCMAYAVHNYFTNTWVGLSVMAAIFIFAVTTVQTVYAVLAYHKGK